MDVIPSRSSADWIRTIYASDAIWQLSKYRRVTTDQEIYRQTDFID